MYLYIHIILKVYILYIESKGNLVLNTKEIGDLGVNDLKQDEATRKFISAAVEQSVFPHTCTFCVSVSKSDIRNTFSVHA